MEKEAGDDFIRRFATFLRSQEGRLAGARSKSASSSSYFSSLFGWMEPEALASPRSTPQRRPPPTILSMDLHHLFYLLMRFEAIGLNIGPLDVKLSESSRPTSYLSMIAAKDRSDTLSISSFASSLSAVSKLSLGGTWWSRPPPPNVDVDLKYIYSSFTVLPALSIRQNDLRVITELTDDPPNDNAIPFDVFRNLQTLELLDIDPRAILGWDRLAESLRSLTIKRSGLEDVSDILIDAVVDDGLRRQGTSPPTVGHRRHQLSSRLSISSRKSRPPVLPDTISEDVEPVEADGPTSSNHSLVDPPPRELSPHKWRFLRHLCVSDNGLTFIPTETLPYLTSITHLDLSSNLLISVPPGLSLLHNLISLNLSDNMIESVLGIYTLLGQVLHVNFSKNRLDSLCGLERLAALERADLRDNNLDDPGEVGRLAVLPNISEVWVEGNPFTQIDEEYRVRCFEYFAAEGKDILLDGTGPSFLESRNLSIQPRDKEGTIVASSSRRSIIAPSPPVVAVGTRSSTKHDQQPPNTALNPKPSTPQLQPTLASSTSSPAPSIAPGASSPVHISPHLAPSKSPIAATQIPPKRRKPKRIVNIGSPDGSESDASLAPVVKLRATRHGRGASEAGPSTSRMVPSSNAKAASADALQSTANRSITPRALMQRSRHSRYSTEGGMPSASSFAPLLPPLAQRKSSEAADGHARHLSASAYDVTGDDVADEQEKSEADAYRARIEALKNEVGDSWLTVLSQSGGFGGGVSSRGREGTGSHAVRS